MLPIIDNRRGPEPYTNEDIFRESSEVRIIHDDTSKFYRVIMKLPVSLSNVNQPYVDEISQAFDEKVKKDDLRTWNVIYSLFLTEKSELWPDTDEYNHPIGMVWKACRDYMPAALKYIDACNLDVQSSTSKSISTKKRRGLPTQKSIPKKSKSVSSERSSPSPQKCKLLTPS